MRPAIVVPALLSLALCCALGARWALTRAQERAPGSAVQSVALPLPDFALTERSGATVRRDDLRGKVWVAGFVFSTCPSVCPRLAAVMSSLQAPLAALPGGADARLVAFSVDPEHDTPEALRGWASKFQADPQRWLFLTGDRGEIWRLAEQGFKLPVAADPGPGHPILHSQKLVLVDREGQVRGWFDPLDDPAEAQRLLEAAGAVLAGQDA